MPLERQPAEFHVLVLALAARLLASAALVGVLALSVAGCKTTSDDITGSIAAANAPRSDADWRQRARGLGRPLPRKSQDPDAAIAYARALRATEQRAQAVAVLEQATIRNPQQHAAARRLWPRASRRRRLPSGARCPEPGPHARQSRLAHPQRAGHRARSAGPPRRSAAPLFGRAQDRAGRAVGVVQSRPLLRADEGPARREASCAGLCAAERRPKVRQNLALVVGLQGRFAEAEKIASADLPPDEAAANVAYLRQMLAHGEWAKKGAATFVPAPEPAT